jgi:hypothetical protein
MKNNHLIKGRKGQKGRGKHSHAFMRLVAFSYIDGTQSLNQLSERFGVPNQTISRWAKQFSSEIAEDINISPMTEQEQKDFEALKKQNEALKKRVEYAEMKTFAFETMVDLAKSELGIDLRKNFGAKQPKE